MLSYALLSCLLCSALCFYLPISFDACHCLLHLFAKDRQTLERLGFLSEKQNVLISLEIK